MELLNYLVTIENLIFLISSYIFFVYFIGIEKIVLSSLSFILYYIYFSYILIFIRFLCGHHPKGISRFYTICLLINSLVMYQVLLISRGVSNIFAKVLVEYNPLNTLFFLCVTNNLSIWFFLFPHFIFIIVVIIIKRILSWEKQIEFI